MKLLLSNHRFEYRVARSLGTLSLVVVSVAVPACKGGSSSSQSSGAENPPLNSDGPGPENQKPAIETPSPENLLRQELANELVANLVNAGLNDTQANAIADHAKQSGSGLGLRSEVPILTVAGPFVKGAVTALALPELSELSDQLQAKALATTMSSTFGSLKGRTADLSVDKILDLQKTMVVAAVTSLEDGGVGGDTAADSVKALTTGAASAVGAAIDRDRAIDALSGIVAGVVESVGATAIATNQLDEVIGSAVEGAVSQMSAAGVDDLPAAASAVAKTSIESLTSLDLPPEVVVSATGKAAEGAVAALIDGGVEPDSLAGVAQQVAASSVSALKVVGIAADDAARAAGSVASGAINGLAKTGLDASQIVRSDSIAAIVAGASSSLASAGVPAEKLATALGDVASKAISAIGSVSDDGAIKEQALKSVVSGSVRSLSDNSLKAVDTTAALAVISQKTVEALPDAKLGDLASKATALVAATAIAQIVASGLTNANSVASMSQKITQSAGAGLATLAKSGRDVSDVGKYMFEETFKAMKAAQGSLGLNAATVTEMVSTTSSATMTGMALAGESSAATSALEALKTASKSEAVLAALQMSESEKIAMTSAVTKAADDTVLASVSELAVCPYEFTDVSIESVKMQIGSLRFCRVDTDRPCPYGLKNSIGQLNWKLLKPGVCEFVSNYLFDSSSLKPASTWSSTSTSSNTTEPAQSAQAEPEEMMSGAGRRYSSVIASHLPKTLGQILTPEAYKAVVLRGLSEPIGREEDEVVAFVRGLFYGLQEIKVLVSQLSTNEENEPMATYLNRIAQSSVALLDGSSPLIPPSEYVSIVQKLSKEMMTLSMRTSVPVVHPRLAFLTASGFMWAAASKTSLTGMDLAIASNHIAAGIMQALHSSQSFINREYVTGVSKAANQGVMSGLKAFDFPPSEFPGWAVGSSRALMDGARSLTVLYPNDVALQGFSTAIIESAADEAVVVMQARSNITNSDVYRQSFINTVTTALNQM